MVSPLESWVAPSGEARGARQMLAAGARARVPAPMSRLGASASRGSRASLGRVADGELAFATDSGRWPTKVLAVEPSGPLVCRVTDASV